MFDTIKQGDKIVIGSGAYACMFKATVSKVSVRHVIAITESGNLYKFSRKNGNESGEKDYHIKTIVVNGKRELMTLDNYAKILDDLQRRGFSLIEERRSI